MRGAVAAADHILDRLTQVTKEAGGVLKACAQHLKPQKALDALLGLGFPIVEGFRVFELAGFEAFSHGVILVGCSGARF